MEITLLIGLMIILSMLVANFLKRINFPAVTGYLIAGMILGPSFFGIVGHEQLADLNYINDIALGIIVFQIGNSFRVSALRLLGKSVAVISACEALLTVILVFAALTIFQSDTSFNLIVAPISAATAPAATLMVIRECKAKGSLTDTLLSVVAISNLTCIILFNVSTAVVAWGQEQNAHFWELISGPLISVLGSLLLGVFLGFLYCKCLRRQYDNGFISVVTLGIVILDIGLSISAGISPLLSCLMLGAIISNYCENADKIFAVTDSVSNPLIILFFVLSGMHLDIKVLMLTGWIWAIYILARAIGKTAGARIGALIGGADLKVANNIGFCLLPQAGVALGLSSSAAMMFPEMGTELMNLILGAVLFFEIIGPIITKKVIMKCGESNIYNLKDCEESVKL